ncbi:hypothetical protein [Pseudomonas sp. CGJS7]|uniref:hypothetical protein n=1 Tax=Pseudomonas sp. CGJS7 TaxID=3109348 RepID=UPI003009FC5B
MERNGVPTSQTFPAVIPAKAGIHFAVACDFALARRSQEPEQDQNGFRLSPE